MYREKQTKSGGNEMFRTCPYWPWDPRNLLYNGHRLSFLWVKRPGRGANHPPPSGFFTFLLLALLLLELDATDWGRGRGMKWLKNACCQQACNLVLQSKAGLAIFNPQEGHIISLRTSSRAAFMYIQITKGEEGGGSKR